MTGRAGPPTVRCELCDDQPLPGVLVELDRDDGDGLWPDGYQFVARCPLCLRFPDDDQAAEALARATTGYTWRRMWNTPTSWRPFLAREGSPRDRDVHLCDPEDQPGKEMREQRQPPDPGAVPGDTMTCICGKAEPVGKAEVAEIAEVQLRTVHTWRQRGNLPPPRYPTVNGSEAWEKGDILMWLAATNRLPPRRRKEANRYCREMFGTSLDTWLVQQAEARQQRR